MQTQLPYEMLFKNKQEINNAPFCIIDSQFPNYLILRRRIFRDFFFTTYCHVLLLCIVDILVIQSGLRVFSS